jgi:23S rRNA pseudouridine2605 synthase
MKKKTPQPFKKFAQKKSNAAIKEQFRQEKRKVKKEREEFFDKKRAETRGGRIESGGGKREAGDGKRTPNSELRTTSSSLMPLNKFIAHAGIAARRDAAEMVKKGMVKVNGELVTEPGHKVSAKDEVKVNGKKVFLAKNLVYILINKPKDYITTTDDPQGRKTVLDLVRRATPERIYPVGRLDRNTSGVLLLTNDGELAQKLTHPSNEVKKVYHVTLNKPLERNDFDRILKGVNLEDGLASVDVLAYPDMKDKTQIGVEIHSGKNRIVRRIFEHLGYDVRNLDRVIFAGLTKKNVERGKWRFLTEKEVRDLKHFGKGK